MYIVTPRRQSVEAKKIIIQVQKVGRIEDLGEKEKCLCQYFISYSDTRQTLFLGLIPKEWQQWAGLRNNSDRLR